MIILIISETCGLICACSVLVGLWRRSRRRVVVSYGNADVTAQQIKQIRRGCLRKVKTDG